MRIINTVTGQPDEVGVDAGQYLSANISEICVPKKLGGNIVSHRVDRQIYDFGDAVSEALSVSWHAGGVNNATTWAANNAAFSAAGAYGARLGIPQGTYYVSDKTLLKSGTIFEGLGLGYWLVYGPAFTGGALAKPLVEVESGASNVSLLNSFLYGVNSTRGVLSLPNASGVRLDNVTIGASDPDHFALDMADGGGLVSRALRVIDTAFGISLHGTALQLTTISFEDLIILANYISVHLRNILSVSFSGVSADMNPITQWPSGPKTVNGVTISNPNDCRGLLFQSGGSASGLLVKNAHFENSIAAAGIGIGIEVQPGSAAVFEDCTEPGWRLGHVLAIGNSYKAKTGSQNIVQLQEQYARAVCNPSPALIPTTVTWGGGSGVTTATTACVQYFDAPSHRGNGNLAVTQVACKISRAGGTETATLELVSLNNVTGAITLVTSFALIDGDNTFTARTNAFGRAFDNSSNLWDGIVGDPADPTYGGTDLSFHWKLTTTPGGGGAVTIYRPRMIYDTGTPRQADSALAISGAVVNLPCANADVSNHGSTGGVLTNHGAVLDSSIATNGTSTWAEMALPALSAWSFACKFQLASTAGGSVGMTIYGADNVPSSGYGVNIGFTGGRFKLYTLTGGWADTGVAPDTNGHILLVTYGAGKLNVWLDGSHVITDDTTHVPDIHDKLLVGSWDGSSNFTPITVTQPTLYDHVLTAAETSRVNTYMGTL